MSEKLSLERQFFDLLMQSQHWSPDVLQRYQRQQLAQSLRHARAQVPFYRDRLDVLFTPSGEIDWDHWAEVPILRRSDLTEHAAELQAVDIPAGHGRRGRVTTSGSSGVPISVAWTTMATLALNANRARGYRWRGVDWTQVCCQVSGNDPTVATWPDGENRGPWGPAWDPAAARGRLMRINRLTPQDKVIEFMQRAGASYLTTGPSAGLALALECERMGMKLQLSGFLPHGAAVSDTDRQAIGRVFGATVVELYSSKEAGNIGHGCSAGDGLHINAETMLVEIVDESGQPVRSGQPGRVLVTPFMNAAQPLIRYDQGDIAEWIDGPCPCGCTLPRISGLIGRITTVFHHPDGRVRPAFAGSHRPLLKCSTWQVAQTGPTSFEVRYVPLDPAVPGDEEQVARNLRQLYFGDSAISFRRLTHIDALPNGKPLEYVNEWLPPPR